MNKQPTTSKSGALSRFFKAAFFAGLLTASAFLLSSHTTFAGSATWQTNPGSGNWNTATNWMPNTVPDRPSDTATFDFSNTTDIAVSVGVGGIVFNAGASAFTITSSSLDIDGTGITNNSGIIQNFVIPADSENLIFRHSATAGSLTAFTINGGVTYFLNQSSAGNGAFTNNGGASSGAPPGAIRFNDTSTAGNGTFTNHGGNTAFYGNSTAGNGTFTISGRANGDVGSVSFVASSTAANGTFTINGATVRSAGRGILSFYNSSSAANATLIANGGLNGGEGGSIYFDATHGGIPPTGGSARIGLFGNGNLDISGPFFAGTGIGSLEGDGDVFLGVNYLNIGRNNLSTAFSGVIQDGGRNGGTGGSLTKVGTGKLVLSHRNTYTGGTTVNRGRLVVNNIGGSGTGSGPVQVNRGKLGGKGEIAGAVTVGTGTGLGAVLAPGYLHGIGSPGALTIQSPLTFHSDGIYEVGMNSSSVMRDEVVALGVTIKGGAKFAFVDIGSGSLPAGTTFTVINNTAATPIAGTFSNLPDGSTFTSNGNSFKANYQGGDGNDLTLKVVP